MRRVKDLNTSSTFTRSYTCVKKKVINKKSQFSDILKCLITFAGASILMGFLLGFAVFTSTVGTALTFTSVGTTNMMCYFSFVSLQSSPKYTYEQVFSFLQGQAILIFYNVFG